MRESVGVATIGWAPRPFWELILDQSSVGRSTTSESHRARDCQHESKVGDTPGSLRSDPTGIMISRPLRVACGSGLPQFRQNEVEKLRAVGRSKRATLSSPDNQRNRTLGSHGRAVCRDDVFRRLPYRRDRHAAPPAGGGCKFHSNVGVVPEARHEGRKGCCAAVDDVSSPWLASAGAHEQVPLAPAACRGFFCVRWPSGRGVRRLRRSEKAPTARRLAALRSRAVTILSALPGLDVHARLVPCGTTAE
jgi:hypothetical protein